VSVVSTTAWTHLLLKERWVENSISMGQKIGSLRASLEALSVSVESASDQRRYGTQNRSDRSEFSGGIEVAIQPQLQLVRNATTQSGW
jgi:hypothetical protein